MFKRILVLFTLIVYCSCTVASIVSDNDGSAFITKAEFDSLKNDFQSQLDSYNTNIDNKIDSAIASYLSGIKVERITSLENKYKSINPTWMKNKRFNKSKLGTKFTEYISFTMVDRGGSGANLKYGVYYFEGTGNSWYIVKPMIKNPDDQEYLYRISKKKISTFDNQWSLQDLIKADYSITVIGGAAGGRGGPVDGDDRLAFPDPTTFTKGTNEYFSTWYSPLQIAIWSVNTSTKTKVSNLGYINGSTGSGGETVAISSVASDLLENDETLFYLAGGSITNDIMYCLNTEDTSRLGNTFATAESNHGSTRQWRVKPDGSSVEEYISWTARDYEVLQFNLGIKAEVYRHKIQEINSTSLLNETITQNVKEKTYYYSGCPLFTATADNAEVKFKIKFKNTAGARTKWALKNSQFTNAANPGNAGGIEECSETIFLADDDETITVKFKVKKNITYWIKAEPESGYSTIEFDGDIVQTEES